MNTINVMSLFMLVQVLVSSQYISIGDQCKCQDLSTELDCNLRGSCRWNSIQMTCLESNQYQSTIVSTSPLKQVEAKSSSLYCDHFSQIECPNQNGCAWFENKCLMFTGCTSYVKSNDDDCKKISKDCFSDGLRCVELDECNTYTYQKSCVISKKGKYCYWNTQNRRCEQVKECNDLPTFLISDSECRTQLQFCTTKLGGGCVESGSCADAVSAVSCVSDRQQGMECFWAEGKCRDKTCENALTSLKTDAQCKEFLSHCTTKANGGCTMRLRCNDAQIEDACIKDTNGNDCFWTGDQCKEKLCENAPPSYVTNQQCSYLSSNCITNGQGCSINHGCTSALKEEFCEKDAEGNPCIWTGVFCTQKKCEDSNFKGDELCSTYMSTCIGKPDDQIGCRTKTCETAASDLITNDDCEKYLPNSNCIAKKSGGCTMNTRCSAIDFESACVKDSQGNKCYWNENEQKCLTVTTCSQINIQSKCIADQFGQPCQWVDQFMNNIKAQCVNKSCSSAPMYIKSEKECNEYYKSDNIQCTLKKGGGCREKSTCQDVDVIDGCTTDKDGNTCLWDQTTSKCRKQMCSDFTELTYFGCSKNRADCTIGFGGQCADLQECSSYLNKMSCVKGTDGVCLWIEHFKDGKGACFQFDSCQSLKWQTDAECKLASNSCTTDGEQCVPITECRSTNINGGCVTGTDGECIQTVPSLHSTESKTCSKFINCSTAYYLTHEECQQAHSFCTTNGETGCRDLTSCEHYAVKESCHLNNKGIQFDDLGSIISTGKCSWDESNQNCREQVCSDLVFKSEDECSQILTNCTSDGEKCVEKQSCQMYIDESICNSRKGIDGPCFWSEGTCRIKQCQEIKQGTNQNACSSIKDCISDGEKCVLKDKCAKYNTKVACNISGVDGICVWDENLRTCQVMNSCNDANNDESACNLANDRCLWDSSQNELSRCSEHSCLSYSLQSGQCQYFKTWKNDKYHICKMIQGKCSQIDATTLTAEECYIYSFYTYSWSPLSNRCMQCSRILENGSNNANSTNSNKTIYQYVLGTITGFFAFAAVL
ncbi:unnamed protein product [Paramecium octaurelia]|uniref:PSI domain-containing protein n=1 Tax=Paramecium octaurelia TaxID=43137 RepID=A0A8S1V208_PAROT|nr:unnamed protein product [Paramecium octaurelia]